jgi:hypothetical protein
VQETPALVSLVNNIQTEIHNLNAAVAALKSVRGQGDHWRWQKTKAFFFVPRKKLKYDPCKLTKPAGA